MRGKSVADIFDIDLTGPFSPSSEESWCEEQSFETKIEEYYVRSNFLDSFLGRVFLRTTIASVLTPFWMFVVGKYNLDRRQVLQILLKLFCLCYTNVSYLHRHCDILKISSPQRTMKIVHVATFVRIVRTRVTLLIRLSTSSKVRTILLRLNCDCAPDVTSPYSRYFLNS